MILGAAPPHVISGFHVDISTCAFKSKDTVYSPRIEDGAPNCPPAVFEGPSNRAHQPRVVGSMLILIVVNKNEEKDPAL